MMEMLRRVNRSARDYCRKCAIGAGAWVSSIAAANAEGSAINADLPRDLSPWGVFLAADWVVKAVMIGLLFASIVTWTIWLAKAIELGVARRRLRATVKSLGSFRTVGDAARELGRARSPAGDFVRAAILELQLTGEARNRDGILARIGSRLDRIELARARNITR